MKIYDINKTDIQHFLITEAKHNNQNNILISSETQA